MKATHLLVLCLATGGSQPLLASGPGSTGGNVLNIGVGARAIGMGEAYTAMADDVSSLHWNPAGIAFMNQSQASFMYNKFMKDLTYQNASVAVPFEYGGLGASLSYLSYGDIQGYDEDGNATGGLSAHSGVATVGAAWLGDFWAAGVSLKGVQQKLVDVTATGVAADAGLNLLYPREVFGGTLRAGAVLRNMGSGLKFINQTDPFPMQWRVGAAAVQMANRKLNVSVDYGKERGLDGAFYAGSEYWLLPFMALRVGYAGTDAEGNGLRGGVGLHYRDFSFDYAYSNFGDLGLSHRYELSLRFGTIQPRLTPEERRLLRRAKIAMAEQRFGEATELLDALIRMEPNYRPVRRLIKLAMAGYERQERAFANHTQYDRAKVTQAPPQRTGDAPGFEDLETLLRLGDDAWTAQKAKKDPRVGRETLR